MSTHWPPILKVLIIMVIIQWCGEHEAVLQQQVSLGPCAEINVLLGQAEWLCSEVGVL